jgi:hypothetical protein
MLHLPSRNGDDPNVDEALAAMDAAGGDDDGGAWRSARQRRAVAGAKTRLARPVSSFKVMNKTPLAVGG